VTPALIAQYRDARSAPVRANREISLFSHVYNMAREWGLTTKEKPCQGVRKNKETPRDFYANDAVWKAVYAKAVEELKVAMDLAYLPGQLLASRISQFQFRDIRPKAASEIDDVDHASLLLGHTKGDITERVYRRVGAIAKPTK
jgi:hypothetical protein